MTNSEQTRVSPGAFPAPPRPRKTPGGSYPVAFGDDLVGQGDRGSPRRPAAPRSAGNRHGPPGVGSPDARRTPPRCRSDLRLVGNGSRPGASCATQPRTVSPAPDAGRPRSARPSPPPRGQPPIFCQIHAATCPWRVARAARPALRPVPRPVAHLRRLSRTKRQPLAARRPARDAGVQPVAGRVPDGTHPAAPRPAGSTFCQRIAWVTARAAFGAAGYHYRSVERRTPSGPPAGARRNPVDPGVGPRGTRGARRRARRRDRQLGAGPFCGHRCAECGAEGSKAEPPGQGDPLRGWGGRYQGLGLFRPSWAGGRGRSRSTSTVRRGRRSWPASSRPPTCGGQSRPGCPARQRRGHRERQRRRQRVSPTRPPRAWHLADAATTLVSRG